MTPLNEKSVLFCTMEGGGELLASEPGDRETPRRTGPGRIALDPDAVLLFDRASGRRFVPADNVEAKI